MRLGLIMPKLNNQNFRNVLQEHDMENYGKNKYWYRFQFKRNIIYKMAFFFINWRKCKTGENQILTSVSKLNNWILKLFHKRMIWTIRIFKLQFKDK